MFVMVACASRHGSTREIAEIIADTLCGHALNADVFQLTAHLEGPHPGGYDALVLGSAIYEGRWLPEAREFVTAHRAYVVAHPVWLFSSGPVAGPGHPGGGPVIELESMLVDVTIREHRLFGGRLVRARLNPDELSLVSGFDVPDADQRDFAAIASWATRIASTLLPRSLTKEMS